MLKKIIVFNTVNLFLETLSHKHTRHINYNHSQGFDYVPYAFYVAKNIKNL